MYIISIGLIGLVIIKHDIVLFKVFHMVCMILVEVYCISSLFIFEFNSKNEFDNKNEFEVIITKIYMVNLKDLLIWYYEIKDNENSNNKDVKISKNSK